MNQNSNMDSNNNQLNSLQNNNNVNISNENYLLQNPILSQDIPNNNNIDELNNMNNNNYNYHYDYQNMVMPDINDLICDQKQFIDDDYLLQLHQRLVQTRELRKLSENGVKVLNGRVRCLKEENQKTLSKINQTDKKTKEKMLNMERKKSQSKERVERIKKLENDLLLLKKKNYNQKMDRDNGLINSRKKVISENKIKGRISKKEKNDIYNIKIMNELNEKNFKKNKIEVIRSQNLQKIQKKKMTEIEKKELIIKDLEEKINFEINRKKELEQEINKMLKEESDTFERINQTNEMQKKIFEDFEKIIRDGSWNCNIINNNDNGKYSYNNENNNIQYKEKEELENNINNDDNNGQFEE